MPWPTIAVGTKLSAAVFAAIKGYIDSDILGAQVTYTPVIKFGTTTYIGGTRDFRYRQLGKHVFVSGQIVLAGTPGGTGAIEISLPVAARMSAVLGQVTMVDASGPAVRVANARGAGSVINLVDDSGAYYTHAVPWTWTVSDVISFSFMYETT